MKLTPVFEYPTIANQTEYYSKPETKEILRLYSNPCLIRKIELSKSGNPRSRDLP